MENNNNNKEKRVYSVKDRLMMAIKGAVGVITISVIGIGIMALLRDGLEEYQKLFHWSFYLIVIGTFIKGLIDPEGAKNIFLYKW